MKKILLSCVTFLLSAAPAFADDVADMLAKVVDTQIIPPEVQLSQPTQVAYDAKTKGYTAYIYGGEDQNGEFALQSTSLSFVPDGQNYSFESSDFSIFSPDGAAALKELGFTFSDFLAKGTVSVADKMLISTNSVLKNLQKKENGKTVIKVQEETDAITVQKLPNGKFKETAKAKVTNSSFLYPLAQVLIPELTVEAEVNGFDKKLVDIKRFPNLSGVSFSSDFISDKISVSSPFIPEQTLSTKLSFYLNEKKADNNLALGFDWFVGGLVLPAESLNQTGTVPLEIKAQFELTGITADELYPITKALDDSKEIEEIPENAEKIEKNNAEYEAAAQVLEDKGYTDIKQISVTSEQWDVLFKGKFAFSGKDASGVLSVWNFDKLSPPAKPVDETLCRAALNDVVSAGSSSPMEALELQRKADELCMPKEGRLEFLRPYLSTAKKVVRDGKTYDDFDVSFDGKTILINGQVFSALPATDME